MIDIKELYIDVNKDIEWIKDNTIFLTVHGSTCYGLSTPESDLDLRGICCPTKEYFLGFNKNFEQWITKTPTDCTIFEIRKFFNLSAKGNPNCLEILFTEPEDHIFVNDLGQKIIDNKNVFLSKLLKESYIGYAKGQAHRIKNHRKYILSPYDHCPTREEFGLKQKPEIEKNQYDAIKSLINSKLETWRPDFAHLMIFKKFILKIKLQIFYLKCKLH